MLYLKNIRKQDGYIEADYYPEGSEERGFVRVDCATGEAVEGQMTSYDSLFAGYFHHARRALLTRYADVQDPPEIATVMWY